MRAGYRPFNSVQDYAEWYFASLSIVESASRHSVSAEGLDDAVCDLSMLSFLTSDEVALLRRVWEEGGALDEEPAYYKLWMKMEKAGWLCDREVYKLLKKGRSAIVFPEGKRTISAKEFGDALDVDARHIYRLVKQGKIPTACFTRVGGSGEFRFFVEEVKALMREWAKAVSSDGA